MLHSLQIKEDLGCAVYEVESLFEVSFPAVFKILDKGFGWAVIMTFPASIKSRFLKSFSLQGKIKDENLSFLVNDSTTCIDLRQCSLTNAGLAKLAMCSNLERFILGSCSKDTGDLNPGLRYVFSGCPKLSVVDLRGFSETDDHTIFVLAHNCPNLQALDISGSKLLTDVALRDIAECCPSLKSLGVNDTMITDNGVLSIANGACAEHLTEFRSNMAKNVTGRAITELLEKCPKLSILTYHNTTESDNHWNLIRQRGSMRMVAFTVDL